MTVYSKTFVGPGEYYISVLQPVHFGSTCSLRSNLKIGSNFSVYRFGISKDGVSALDYLAMGSSFSLRGVGIVSGEVSSFSKMLFSEGATSILNFATAGSSMSMRCQSKIGSSMSMYSKLFGSGRLSVLDFVQIGSS